MPFLGKHPSKLSLVLVATATCIFVSSLSTVQAWSTIHSHYEGDRLVAEFVGEAPKKWHAYAQKCVQIQGSVTIRSESKDGSSSAWKLTLKSNKDCRLAITSTSLKSAAPPGRSSYKEEVVGFNSVYSFVLNRNGPDDTWVHADSRLRGSGMLPRVAMSFPKTEDMAAGYLVGLVDIALPDLVSQPGFRVLEAKRIELDGEQLISVKFENQIATGGSSTRSGTRLTGGLFILDPSQYWCLRSADLRTPYSFDRIRCTYKVAEGLPIPVSRVREIEIDTDKGKDRGTETTVYDLSLPRVLPSDDEFTLSTFGLPELHGVSFPQPTPWFLYAGMLGGAILVICVLLAWWQKRLQVRAA